MTKDSMCFKKSAMRFLFCTVMWVATLVGYSNASADDTPIEVQSTSGASVLVSPSEIKKAYLQLAQRKSKNADSIAVNEDGSFTINRPYFNYNGKLRRIDYGSISALGVCRRFGFQNRIGYEPQKVSSNETIVYLNDDGNLSDILPGDDSNATAPSVLETVACR